MVHVSEVFIYLIVHLKGRAKCKKKIIIIIFIFVALGIFLTFFSVIFGFQFCHISLASCFLKAEADDSQDSHRLLSTTWFRIVQFKPVKRKGSYLLQ